MVVVGNEWCTVLVVMGEWCVWWCCARACASLVLG